MSIEEKRDKAVRSEIDRLDEMSRHLKERVEVLVSSLEWGLRKSPEQPKVDSPPEKEPCCEYESRLHSIRRSIQETGVVVGDLIDRLEV